VKPATTDVNANAQRHAEQRQQQRAAAHGTATPQAAGEQERRDVAAIGKARRRFVTFNTFVDAVGRYLPASDREVWHVLFRFADAATNVAEVRLADIAARLDCHARTTSRSVDRLCATGLVERIKRGTRQGGPSRYRIDPEPARHVDALRAAWEARQPQRSDDSNRPSRNPSRSSSGQFTT
jgi:hypothetical protein